MAILDKKKLHKYISDMNASREGVIPELPESQDNSVSVEVGEPTLDMDKSEQFRQLRQAMVDTDRNVSPDARIEQPVKPSVEMLPGMYEDNGKLMYDEHAPPLAAGAAEHAKPAIGDVSQAGAAAKTVGRRASKPTQTAQTQSYGPSGAQQIVKEASEEVPQTTTDNPVGQVPNEQLADAVNATSAASTTSDVQKATQREHGVGHSAAYWAALAGVARAASSMGGSDPSANGATSFYDAKIKEVNDDNTRQQQLMRDYLKNKFEAEQTQGRQTFEAGQKDKDRQLTQARDTATAEHYHNLETQNADRLQLDRDRLAEERRWHDMRRGGAPNGMASAGPLKPAQVEMRTSQAMKDAPSVAGTEALKRLVARLNDPAPLGGWDTAGIAEGLAGSIPVIGKSTAPAIGQAVRGIGGGDDSKRVYQDAMTMLQEISLETSGKVVNEQEIGKIIARMGLLSSEEEFRRGMSNELKNIQERTRRWYNSQAPQVRAELDARGVLPDIMNLDIKVPEPRPGLPGLGANLLRTANPVGGFEGLYDMLKEKYGNSDDAVEHAKEMATDEEARKRYRKANKIEP